MDDHKVQWKNGIPTEPGELREWLAEWHKEHNGITPAQDEERAPGYILTAKGRQLLALSTEAKN
jgi:hypothetical protein